MLSTPTMYVILATITLGIALAVRRPIVWRVQLVPGHHVEPGEDVLVPVGDTSNCRRMRVMEVDGDAAKAIDIRDQQHQNSLCIAMAVVWPIALPVMGVLAVAAFVGRISDHKAAGMAQFPRPRTAAHLAAGLQVGPWRQ